MLLELRCHEEDIEFIDWFFMLQEFNEEPEYDEIKIYTEHNVYNYRIIRQFDKWFIVTD